MEAVLQQSNNPRTTTRIVMCQTSKFYTSIFTDSQAAYLRAKTH